MAKKESQETFGRGGPGQSRHPKRKRGKGVTQREEG